MKILHAVRIPNRADPFSLQTPMRVVSFLPSATEALCLIPGGQAGLYGKVARFHGWWGGGRFTPPPGCSSDGNEGGSGVQDPPPPLLSVPYEPVWEGSQTPGVAGWGVYSPSPPLLPIQAGGQALLVGRSHSGSFLEGTSP